MPLPFHHICLSKNLNIHARVSPAIISVLLFLEILSPWQYSLPPASLGSLETASDTMTTATEEAPTTSRGKQIPGTMVHNWQAAKDQPAKPLIRRPPTACESCRTAKVKCDGKTDCSRCKIRGLSCIYTPKPNCPSSQLQQQTPRDQSPPETQGSSSNGDYLSDAITLDLGILQEVSGDAPAYTFTPPEDVEFPDDSFQSDLVQFDWPFPGRRDLGPSVSFEAPTRPTG
jgi:hypothetical protein